MKTQSRTSARPDSPPDAPVSDEEIREAYREAYEASRACAREVPLDAAALRAIETMPIPAEAVTVLRDIVLLKRKIAHLEPLVAGAVSEHENVILHFLKSAPPGPWLKRARAALKASRVGDGIRAVEDFRAAKHLFIMYTARHAAKFAGRRPRALEWEPIVRKLDRQVPDGQRHEAVSAAFGSPSR